MSPSAPIEGAPGHEAEEQQGSPLHITSDDFAQDLKYNDDNGFWPSPALAAAKCFVAIAPPEAKEIAFKLQCVALGRAVERRDLMRGTVVDALIGIARAHGLEQQYGFSAIEYEIRWGFELAAQSTPRGSSWRAAYDPISDEEAEAILSANKPAEPPSNNDDDREWDDSVYEDALWADAAYEDRKDRDAKASPDRVEPPNKKRFPLTAFDDVVYKPTREYFVPRKGLFLVYGPPKSGKSFWVLDLAMHIALGLPYRGQPLLNGPVVYIAAEGTGGFPKRIEAFRRRHGGHGAPFHLCLVRPDLIADHPVLISDIRAQLGAFQEPVAVVVDTLNRTLVGSESKDGDMARYLNAASAIEDSFGCAVILVHHSGLEPGRPRGHTSAPAAADVMISIEPFEPNLVVATVELSKDGPSGNKLVSRLEVVEVGRDEDDKPVTSCVIIPVDDPPPEKKPSSKLSKRDELARRTLVDLLAEGGAVAAPSIAPIGTKAIKVDDWRDACYSRGIFGDDVTPATRRKAFQRAKDQLQLCAIIGERDGLVWLAKPEASQ
jgi:hypothetical protein